MEREYLQENYEKGKCIRAIAKTLGRSPSTISRELKRNCSKKAKHYNPWHAQTYYIHRRKNCHRKNHLLEDKEMFDFAYAGLLQFWSPEIIAGRWNVFHEKHFSFSSVYRAVRSGLFPGIKPQTHFRRRGKPYANQKKSYTKYFESSIHDRPEEAEPGVKVYFADTHAPWQRGSNENINGLIRFFFPRGTNFKQVSQEQLDAVVALINNRPRKCLGFLSPLEYVALGLTI